jgi:hypothetical protein
MYKHFIVIYPFFLNLLEEIRYVLDILPKDGHQINIRIVLSHWDDEWLYDLLIHDEYQIEFKDIY